MQDVRTSYLTLCLAGLAALWCLSATDSVPSPGHSNRNAAL